MAGRGGQGRAGSDKGGQGRAGAGRGVSLFNTYSKGAGGIRGR